MDWQGASESMEIRPVNTRMACAGSMPLYVFTSEGNSMRTFGVNLASEGVRAQKRCNECVITGLTHMLPKDAWSLRIINWAPRISRLAGIGDAAPTYKDAGLEFGGERMTKRACGIGQQAHRGRGKGCRQMRASIHGSCGAGC
jgi:hypothetical protein